MQLEHDHIDAILLSRMDTIFMFCYAIGSFFSGNIGDMYHAPTVIAWGLIGSGICVFTLVLGVWSGISEMSAFTSDSFFIVSQYYYCLGCFHIYSN